MKEKGMLIGGRVSVLTLWADGHRIKSWSN